MLRNTCVDVLSAEGNLHWGALGFELFTPSCPVAVTSTKAWWPSEHCSGEKQFGSSGDLMLMALASKAPSAHLQFLRHKRRALLPSTNNAGEDEMADPPPEVLWKVRSCFFYAQTAQNVLDLVFTSDLESVSMTPGHSFGLQVLGCSLYHDACVRAAEV